MQLLKYLGPMILAISYPYLLTIYLCKMQLLYMPPLILHSRQLKPLLTGQELPVKLMGLVTPPILVGKLK